MPCRPSVESKTSYVAEWAARHGTILPEARHTAVLPEARHTAVLPESRHTTEETLSLEEGRRWEGLGQIVKAQKHDNG